MLHTYSKYIPSLSLSLSLSLRTGRRNKQQHNNNNNNKPRPHPAQQPRRRRFSTKKSKFSKKSKEMEYKSTRGGISNVSFEFAVRAGLAPDGGLFVPQTGIPKFSNQKLKNMRESSFSELALNVMSEFIGEKEIPRQDLKKLIERTYATNKPFVIPRLHLL